jgi:phosphatidylglycerol:prolipoprotein diacylglycerol transferase
MRQTLFLIPAAFFGPLGYLSIAWLIFSAVLLFWLVRRQGWNAETRSYLPVIGLMWLAIAFVLPALVESGGVPIRGYGVMVLLGVISGVALAAYLARRMGLDPEVIFSLAFVMFIAAIVGARAFYVVQYWDQFIQVETDAGPRSATLLETLGNIANVTKGGLVVYGALLAGLAAGVWFLRRRQLPILAVGDLIAPSIMLGLALGRLGCLMNGCCFGGVCQTEWVGPIPVLPLTFPGKPESPPYQHQLEHGLAQGIILGERMVDGAARPIVAAIDPQSPAAKTNLQPGDVITQINAQAVGSLQEAQAELLASRRSVVIQRVGGEPVRWALIGAQPPARSLPVFPAQIYASINAAILTLLLWAAYPFRPRDGFVIALLLTLYPLTRFLEEVIRSDEPGRFGTGLTIAQLVSLALAALAVPLWLYVFRQPARLALPRGANFA